MKDALKKSAKAAGKLAFAATEPLLDFFLEKRAARISIDRPIIVIGPERSGTSFVYALLAAHPDVYALTAAADHFPDHPFSASLTRRILSLNSTQNYRVMPKTIGVIHGGRFPLTEAIQYWARHLGTLNGGWKSEPDDFFTEEDLDDATRQTLPLDLKKRLFIIQRKRLLMKQPGFSLKIRYLNALFPDAIFVHCLRNPFDNFVSLLKQKMQADNPNWGLRIPERFKLPNASIEAQTAEQLAVTYEIILESIARIENGTDRHVPIRYESFQTAFAREVQKLFQRSGLDAPQDVLEHPELFVASNSKQSLQSVTDDEQALQILEKLSKRMGYDFSETPSGAVVSTAV